MNYIKRLQEENSELQARINRIQEVTMDLMAYAQSEKFSGGGDIGTYVSKYDVIARTQLILNEINI
jgi:hypothetical protein